MVMLNVQEVLILFNKVFACNAVSALSFSLFHFNSLCFSRRINIYARGLVETKGCIFLYLMLHVVCLFNPGNAKWYGSKVYGNANFQWEYWLHWAPIEFDEEKKDQIHSYMPCHAMPFHFGVVCMAACVYSYLAHISVCACVGVRLRMCVNPVYHCTHICTFQRWIGHTPKTMWYDVYIYN